MVKNRKAIIEFCIFKLVLVPNFSLNWQVWFFWPDLPKKGFSWSKTKRWTPRIFYIILHIQINLVRNLSSNWRFWFFGPNLKRYFRSKIEKLNVIIDFRIFKLILLPNFGLNWQSSFFWPDVPNKGFFDLKQNTWTPHIFYIILHIQTTPVRNFSSNCQFNFLDQIFPK